MAPLAVDPAVAGGFLGFTDAARKKQTRIICTLGPACWSVEMLGVLLDNGMNIARLNFSHGDHAAHAGTIVRLKEALAARPGVTCGIMLDTKGPEIRTGFFANAGGKLELAAGSRLVLTTDYDHKSDGTISASRTASSRRRCTRATRSSSPTALSCSRSPRCSTTRRSRARS
jgi:hypothetical protein